MENDTPENLNRDADGDAAPVGGLGSEIASLFVEDGLTSEIPELRGHPIKPLQLES